MGGLQTLHAGVRNTDLFHYLGVFSSGWFANNAKLSDPQYEFMKNNASTINGNLKSFFIFPALPDDAPLELKCVKNYLQKYDVKNIPVDIDVNQIRSNDETFMLKAFESDEAHKKFQREYNALRNLQRS